MDNSLDNLILSPYQKQLLYPRGVTNTEFVRKEVNTEKKVVYEGNAKSKVLVGIDITFSLSESDKFFLGKLLGACKLSMEDIALVNLNQQEVDFPDILEQLQSEKVILFGVPIKATKLELLASEEKLMTLEDRIFIRTIPLHQLQNDVNRKKRLWNAFKEMFGL